MKKENIEKGKLVMTAISNCEDFISNCDYFIRNTKPNEIPALDRWVIHAVQEGVISSKDLVHLITDLRDIVTTRLSDLDKKLEAL